MRLAFISSAKAFNPTTDVAGNKFWLNVDSLAGTGDGTALAAWNDSSANAINFTQAGSAKPTYSASGGPSSKPCVAFSAQYLLSAAQTQANPYTLFGSLKLTTTGSGQNFFGTGASGGVIAGSGVSGTVKWYMSAGTALFSATVVDTNWHIYVASFNGASSKLWLDGGTSIASGNSGTNGFSSATMEVGGFAGSGSWTGSMTDVLLYSGALSNSDIDKVANYIAGLRSLTWSPSS